MSTMRSSKLLNDLMDLVIKLGPGAKLPDQATLAHDYQSSRTLIREQLAILEYLQIIRVRPKTGTTINQVVQWVLRNDDVKDWADAMDKKAGADLTQ